ncbi:MAG TPA: hypothetical protein VMV52_06020 [Candidatus Nanopelagicaceae bacterium]|nr:hypothetical protein [Candidatus Nanopelagicaceae bacterium]
MSKRLQKERQIDLEKWSGPTRPYDLVKEIVVAFVAVAVLACSLAALFSSPDEKALTVQSWVKAAPADFAITAAGELAGTTTSAGYGPPYNNAAEGQSLGPLKIQKWVGIHIPNDSATSFVVTPLATLGDPTVDGALSQWNSASGDQQVNWATAYQDALTTADAASVPDSSGDFGPVPTMITALAGMANSGGLDGALATSQTPLPTDFTKPMLFLADSEGYFGEKATEQHLQGDQWGMMNETGSYPGQSWLWLFSFWYQIEPFKSSDNADAQVMGIMGLLSMGFIFLPLIPGVRKVPYLVPMHRLIWKKWYARRQ